MSAYYTFEDHSGVTTPSKSENPYDGLLEACENDPSQIQARYSTHREKRTEAQKGKLLSPDFLGVTPDQILAKLEKPSQHPDFQDWRHCFVFWARPPQALRTLIAEIQQKLLSTAPNLWVMPPLSLHMTALEITHSQTAPEVEDLAMRLGPMIERMSDYTYTHRARLVKPKLSYDAQAIALSFLPAAGEPSAHADLAGASGDAYSYHHLRRDLYSLSESVGVKVASRYVVPSAHLTIARFVTTDGFEVKGEGVDRESVASLIRRIEEINGWLEAEYWPKEAESASEGSVKAGGEWIVGQEKGLDCRKGALWYGNGGETVRLGRGF
ncbi:hypothetical protein MBLNU230_g0973t1 [Neophaeotheca triangularis]